jgi:hypothetical protein
MMCGSHKGYLKNLREHYVDVWTELIWIRIRLKGGSSCWIFLFLKAKYYFTMWLSMYTCKDPWYPRLDAHESFRRECSYSQKNNCYQPLWYAGLWVQFTGQLNVPWVNDRRLTSSLYSHSYRLFIVKDAPDSSLSPVTLQNMKTRNDQVTVKIGLLIS